MSFFIIRWMHYYLCLFGESLWFEKIWGEFPACIDLTKMTICCITTNISIYWLNAMKLSLVYFQFFSIWLTRNFVYSMKVSNIHLREKPYVLWTGLRSGRHEIIKNESAVTFKTESN
jgi:hypothetical protein